MLFPQNWRAGNRVWQEKLSEEELQEKPLPKTTAGEQTNSHPSCYVPRERAEAAARSSLSLLVPLLVPNTRVEFLNQARWKIYSIQFNQGQVAAVGSNFCVAKGCLSLTADAASSDPRTHIGHITCRTWRGQLGELTGELLLQLLFCSLPSAHHTIKIVVFAYKCNSFTGPAHPKKLLSWLRACRPFARCPVSVGADLCHITGVARTSAPLQAHNCHSLGRVGAELPGYPGLRPD